MKNHAKRLFNDTDVAEDVKDIIAGGPVPGTLNQFGRLLHLQHFKHFLKNLKKYME